MYCQVDIVQMLLDAKADPNASLLLKLSNGTHAEGISLPNVVLALNSGNEQMTDLLMHAQAESSCSDVLWKLEEFEKLPMFFDRFLGLLCLMKNVSMGTDFSAALDESLMWLDEESQRKVSSSMKSVYKYLGWVNSN